MIALKVVDNKELELVEVDEPHPGPGEVRIKLKAAAINKRDYWISKDKYPGIVAGTTLGSDGAGDIDEIGQGVSKTWLDRAVLINPNINWGKNPNIQSAEYKILGMPVNGTFANYIIVPLDRVVVLPVNLSYEEGAALPLAGLTAYRACFHHGGISEGKRVLVSGFGGGVAHFAFLFAQAVGAKLTVTTGHALNMVKAKELGAEYQFNYNETDWIQQAAERVGGFDVIIDSAGGDQFNNLIKILNPGGRIVFYGASNGLPTSLDLYRLFWKQGTIQGSTMGNDDEFTKMVSFVEERGIKPLISRKYPFEQIENAIEQMKNTGTPGKTVILFK